MECRKILFTAAFLLSIKVSTRLETWLLYIPVRLHMCKEDEYTERITKIQFGSKSNSIGGFAAEVLTRFKINSSIFIRFPCHTPKTKFKLSIIFKQRKNLPFDLPYLRAIFSFIQSFTPSLHISLKGLK